MSPPRNPAVGLDREKDHIVEIAVIITDGVLDRQILGPSLVVHQSDSVLKDMSQWCVETFTKNGLLQEIKDSVTTLSEAENAVLSFVRMHTKKGEAPLGGNSCYCDRMFIQREMSQLNAYLSPENLDVSSLAQCCYRWSPYVPNAVVKSGAHRGLSDIKESVEELRVYKKLLFGV